MKDKSFKAFIAEKKTVWGPRIVKARDKTTKTLDAINSGINAVSDASEQLQKGLDFGIAQKRKKGRKKRDDPFDLDY